MIKWLVTLVITSMIFFPEKNFYEKPESYNFDWEDVVVRTEDQVQIHGWYIKAPSPEGTILFLHGNAGNIADRLFKVKGWVDRGFSVLLIDYRSYGKSEGSIKDGNDLVLDAEAGMRWLFKEKEVPLSKLVIYGESLGTYPAIRLAEKNAAAALILESPFTSFKDLAPIHYSMVPKFIAEQLLNDFEFPNKNHIEKIQTPSFIVHGTQDEICPYAMGEELFDLAPEPKGFLSIPGGTHNDLPMSGGLDYWEKPYQFVKSRLEERA